MCSPVLQESHRMASITSGNFLLDRLPAETMKRLGRHLVPWDLAVGTDIHVPGERLEFVCFPTRGLISVVAMLKDGSAIEINMVGREGMFSVAAILGDNRPSQGAMVQLAGHALRMRAQLFLQEIEGNSPTRQLMLRYAQAVMSSISQTAACNRLHQLEQRCARWLLAARDRATGDTFPLTHEFLAMMLGVRRPGVTVAAQALQASGFITYSHGTMTIVDREGLEAHACECYRVIKDEFERLLATPANKSGDTIHN
jgi:CRP-like cAMP-binding protein